MFAKFFKSPSLVSCFSDDFTLATDKIISYEYTKRFSKSGDFSLVMPFKKDFLKALFLNGIIYFDGDWLWIQNISYDGQQISVTGKDSKAFLETRIVLPDDTGFEGYSSVEGTTSQCIENYLVKNCISPTDSNRKLPLIFKGGAVGLTNDHYMTRFEYLSDVITNLCDNADIGFDIRGRLASKGFEFITLGGTDRSFAQSQNPRVILSAKWRNVLSQTFEHGVDNLLNAVYGTDSQNYSRLIPTSANGISRRECNISVSVPTTDSWFEKYALNEVKDNFETHSFEISVPFGNYGQDYILGDTVTVKDDFTGDLYNRKITEVTKSYSNGQRSVSLVLGQQKQKPFQKIVNNLINKTQQRK